MQSRFRLSTNTMNENKRFRELIKILVHLPASFVAVPGLCWLRDRPQMLLEYDVPEQNQVFFGMPILWPTCGGTGKWL